MTVQEYSRRARRRQRPKWAAPVAGLLALALLGGCAGKAGKGSGDEGKGDANALAGIGTEEALSAPDCDRASGKIKISFVYRPTCVKPWNDGGDNGGATTQGVTAGSIKVIVYSLGGFGGDTLEQAKKDQAATVKMFEDLYQTWGRKVELEYFVGTAQTPNDEVAQHADAIAIADKKPFAVMSPPPIVMRDLAARKIISISTGVPVEQSVKLAPYMWGAARVTDKAIALNAADYVGTRLAGKPARWAGDTAFHSRARTFGLMHAETWGDGKEFERRLDDHGAKLAVTESYTDLDRSTWDQRAKLAVTKMKAEGVTSVVLGTNVLFTTSLVAAATNQQWFPEWILTGAALQDLNYFSQSNDQSQWKHAFGIGEFPINTDATGVVPGPLVAMYKWYYNKVPSPAGQGTNMFALYTGIHAAGPKLTPESFRDGLFAQPPAGGAADGAVTSEQFSFGRHGFFDFPDYNAGDDFTEIYWDPEAIGLDRTGRVSQTKGAFRYLDGGKRTVAGKWPTTEPKMFNPTGTTTGIDFKGYPPNDMPPQFPCTGCPSQSGGRVLSARRGRRGGVASAPAPACAVPPGRPCRSASGRWCRRSAPPGGSCSPTARCAPRPASPRPAPSHRLRTAPGRRRPRRNGRRARRRQPHRPRLGAASRPLRPPRRAPSRRRC